MYGVTSVGKDTFRYQLIYPSKEVSVNGYRYPDFLPGFSRLFQTLCIPLVGIVNTNSQRFYVLLVAEFITLAQKRNQKASKFFLRKSECAETGGKTKSITFLC